MRSQVLYGMKQENSLKPDLKQQKILGLDWMGLSLNHSHLEKACD